MFGIKGLFGGGAGDVGSIIKKYGGKREHLIAILHEIQAKNGFISDDNAQKVADEMNLSTVDIEGVITFYHFFTKNQTGKYSIYLNNNPVCYMQGRDKIAAAFEKEVGCKFGSVTADEKIGLFDTSCIGMNDQEPAALINGVVFTSLTEGKVKDIVVGLKAGKAVIDLVRDIGDGNNQNDLVKAMVKNNIIKTGDVIFSDYESGVAIKKAVALSSADIIDGVKVSSIRGRGGAGFPTGMKWDFCVQSKADKYYVVCNADEGEPGTFKDRVLLTEKSAMVFEGMAVAGYAIGAKEGILYLRSEYSYLKPFLESVIDELKGKNILGDNISGKSGFSFDIIIKLGAGAYICGEESALIESAEGKRGEPRNRPPFPVQKGYNDKPTIVNNVETYASVSRIMEKGADWFKDIGTKASTGTKVLSISGDCEKPGIYEVPFGTTISELLTMSGAKDVQAVQVGGPSGNCIAENDFGRKICYDDLGTGGSFMVIGKDRDLLEIVENFMEFFVEESCGWCAPCRIGNTLILETLKKIRRGNGSKDDLAGLESCCETTKGMSRCGFGQTSPNPVLTTIANFKALYESKIKDDYQSEFNMEVAVKDSCEFVKRTPNL